MTAHKAKEEAEKKPEDSRNGNESAREKSKHKSKQAPKKRQEEKSPAAEEKKPESGKTEEPQPVVDESYLRLKADFDNYRKRVLREKDEIYRRANEDIMEELLPVLDHLDMALQHAGEDDNPVVEGFRMVGSQLLNALKKFGLAEIEAEDAEFDPNLHEAILHMPSEDVAENHIVSVTRKGYKLGDRLLRASQVVVSSGPQNAAESDE